MEANYVLYFIREALCNLPLAYEKRMFGGTCFMVNNKMCICANENAILCRIGHEQATLELEKGTCRPMMMNGRTSKDYVYVDLEDVKTMRQLNYWINLCMHFNPMAKASKR